VSSARRDLLALVPHASRAVIVVCAVEIGLRVSTLPRVATLLGVPLLLLDAPVDPHVLGPRFLGAADVARYRAARAVSRRWPWGRSGPCLQLALTAGWLLRHRRAGIALGTTARGGRTIAHAWVVVDGYALDQEAAGYVPLTTV